MGSNNKPLKKINNTPTNKKKSINRDKIIKKRIEILLTVGVIGLIIGLVIGILLPIGGVKKSEYEALKNTNKDTKLKLIDANKKIDELKNEVEENKIFINLENEKKEKVIKYIDSLSNEEVINTTDIFDKVYNTYAYSVGDENFGNFNSIVDTFGYQYDITENDGIKQIVIKDEYSGDFVTLQFKKISDNQDLILSSIRYTKGDKYIEVNSTDESNLEYIIYNDNGKISSVSNLNEQIQFLFKG